MRKIKEFVIEKSLLTSSLITIAVTSRNYTCAVY